MGILKIKAVVGQGIAVCQIPLFLLGSVVSAH